MTEEKPVSPVLIALAAVAGIIFVAFAGAGIVSEFVGAYWPRERASEPVFDLDAGGP